MVAIKIEGLSKQYRLGRKQKSYRTLRDSAVDAFTRSFQAIRSIGKRTNGGEQIPSIWALRDISAEIREGEVVGLIGRNGAGKSTLLKILSRITDPTEGHAEICGRIGSLLEVGTGFHPELTGRENVFLNGAILGMAKKEIERKFDEIVAFAEVERFVDTPVKHYSSGMYLRLAFAVAAHLEPEILLVDEVLAVGDASFQQKCLGKMGEVAETGRTVLFVSHNMGAVTGLCNRAIWIDNGSVMADGPVDDVTQQYLRSFSSGSFSHVNEAFEFQVTSVVIRDGRGEPSFQFSPGDDLVVEVGFRADKPIKDPYIWIIVDSVRGPCFAANTLLDGSAPQMLEGEGRFVCRFKSIPLLPQSYTIRMGISALGGKPLMKQQEVASFSVVGDLSEYGFKGEYQTRAARSVPVMIPYEWVLSDGSVVSMDLRFKQGMVS